MIVYRADTRGPEEIRRTGFKARNPMSLAAARAHLLSYCTSSKKPLDLSRRIISSPQPEYVSTDPTQGCGGYSGKGYVYRIEIQTLGERPWSNEVLGQNLNLKANMLWPKLLLDANALGAAKVIALKHFGTATREVTFLTDIPGSSIKAYRKSGETTFKACK
jgi:hypothetical protein